MIKSKNISLFFVLALGFLSFYLNENCLVTAQEKDTNTKNKIILRINELNQKLTIIIPREDICSSIVPITIKDYFSSKVNYKAFLKDIKAIMFNKTPKYIKSYKQVGDTLIIKLPQSSGLLNKRIVCVDENGTPLKNKFIRFGVTNTGTNNTTNNSTPRSTPISCTKQTDCPNLCYQCYWINPKGEITSIVCQPGDRCACKTQVDKECSENSECSPGYYCNFECRCILLYTPTPIPTPTPTPTPRPECAKYPNRDGFCEVDDGCLPFNSCCVNSHAECECMRSCSFREGRCEGGCSYLGAACYFTRQSTCRCLSNCLNIREPSPQNCYYAGCSSSKREFCVFDNDTKQCKCSDTIPPCGGSPDGGSCEYNGSCVSIVESCNYDSPTNSCKCSAPCQIGEIGTPDENKCVGGCAFTEPECNFDNSTCRCGILCTKIDSSDPNNCLQNGVCPEKGNSCVFDSDTQQCKCAPPTPTP